MLSLHFVTRNGSNWPTLLQIEILAEAIKGVSVQSNSKVASKTVVVQNDLHLCCLYISFGVTP